MTKVLFPQALQDYAEAYTTAETPVLAALNRETNEKVHGAQMLSGHLQGAFLQMMSHALKPKYVLELGTYTGYSAICLAAGLQEGGEVHTIDVDEKLRDMCRHYFNEAGVGSKIIQHTGKAADIIPTLPQMFDLIFIDADKGNYGVYYELVLDKLAPGGMILADNVLFNGEVVLPQEEQSKNAKAVHAFNQKVQNDPRVEHMLLPLRDGVMMVRKKYGVKEVIN